MHCLKLVCNDHLLTFSSCSSLFQPSCKFICKSIAKIMSRKEWGQLWAPRTYLFVAVNLGDFGALIHLAGKVSHATVITLDWYSCLVELVWLFLQGACHWWPPLDWVAVEEGVPGVAKAIAGWLNLHPHCWYLTFFVELLFQRDHGSEALSLILKHRLKLKA